MSNHVDLALSWLRFFACITYRFPLLALQKCKIVSQASNEKLWEHKSLQSNQSFNKWSGLSSVAMTLPLSHQVQFSNRFNNDPQCLNLMKTVFKVLLSFQLLLWTKRVVVTVNVLSVIIVDLWPWHCKVCRGALMRTECRGGQVISTFPSSDFLHLNKKTTLALSFFLFLYVQ